MKRRVSYTDDELDTIYGNRKVELRKFITLLSKAIDNDDWRAVQSLVDKQRYIVIDLKPCNKTWAEVKREWEELDQKTT